MTPFCIVGTPRSRTTWLSRLLSFDGFVCEHEPSKFFVNGPQDLHSYFSQGRGAVDSGLTLRWRDVYAVPGMRMIAVERPIEEVEQSFHRLGIKVPWKYYSQLEATMNDMRDTVPIIPSEWLSRKGVADWVFRWAHGHNMPASWRYHWISRRVQPDIIATTKIAKANVGGLLWLFSPA